MGFGGLDRDDRLKPPSTGLDSPLPLQGKWGLLGAVAVGIGLLWAIDPSWIGFPMCTFHRWTGYYCPGCGGLRAGHALLHGRLAEAWSYNPLVVLLVPWVGYGVVAWGWSVWRGDRAWPGRWLYGPVALTLVGFAAVIFGVLRNLPWAPFCFWAPGAG